MGLIKQCGCAFYCLFAFVLLYNFLPQSKNFLNQIRTSSPKSFQHNITILLWHWPFGVHYRLDGNVCLDKYGIPGCTLMDNRSLFTQADVVVFHHHELWTGHSKLPLHLPRPPLQKWLWLSLEPPMNNHNLSNYNGLFNWTMSYRCDADIFMPYGELVSKKTNDTYVIPKKGDCLIGWVVSRYKANQKRSLVFQQLEKHMPSKLIKVYGHWSKRPLSKSNLLSTISRCYFYLAFENSISTDYITEKLWRNSFQAGSVPVVLGPPRIHVHERVNRAERHFRCLPDHHQKLLTNFLSNLSKIRYCIDRNQEVLQAVVHNCIHMFENMEYGEDSLFKDDPRKVRPASTFDMDKLKSTIKQFVRDWSETGKAERDSCYKPLIDEIQRLFPPDQCDVSQIRVLVPGAGLGRLAWEIAYLGYSCQGNEWSFFMLFSSNFVLNRCDGENTLTLYPWIHQFSNNKMTSDQTRPVTFPDINPQSLPADSDFSMVAGDFQEIYTDPDAWDCVATCFFIDTAHNVLDYIETIWNILKPGGVWMNLGPLLYHYENMANELSIELSYEDIKAAILKYGFVLELERESVSSTYTENDRSMLKYLYDSVFFIVRKPAEQLINGDQTLTDGQIEDSLHKEETTT